MARARYDEDEPIPRTGGTQPQQPVANEMDAQIEALYQQYLKRPATPAELSAHRANPSGMDGVLGAILNSAEYKALQTAPTTPTTPTPENTTPLPRDVTTRPGDEYLEGFDANKLANKDKQTIKYRAARVFQSFTPMEFVQNPAAVIAALKAAGLNPTLIGKDKIDFNDGNGPIDVVRDATGGGKAWQFGVVGDTIGSILGSGAAATGDGTTAGTASDYPGGLNRSPGSADAATSNSINPDYLTPWERTFAAPAGAANPAFPAWDPYGEFQGPGEFKAPTAESMLADPSYQWRLNQGQGAIENSAAARGVLNSGGTLADILNYGQGAASQEYQNIWNRDLTKWGTDWQNALNKFTTNFGVNQSNFGNLLTKYNTQRADADTAYNRAWQQFVEDKDTWYRNQNEPFSKIYNMAALGANASQ